MKDLKGIKILHRNLIIGLEKALNENFFVDNRYADKVLERTLKLNKKWGSKDRGFISESFYEIIRWKKQLEFYANKEVTSDNIYYIIATYLLKNKIEIPLFPEFEKVYIKKIKDRFKLPFPSKSIEYSIPNWFEALFKKELGDNWEKEIKALNIPASTILRVNTLKISKEELKNKLEDENIFCEFIPGYPDALILEEKRNVFKTDSFKNGFFEIQDASSQEISRFAEVSPGMKVIDACAGAGGKTLHLAALMKNKGNIIALDIHEWKLQTLKLRARRNGAHNIQVKTIEDSKTLKRLYNSADRVLIDAPCSGLGVLKRNPDAKWKLKEEFFKNILLQQKDILSNNSKMVKKGGLLIYATCSILPSENTKQVHQFLSENSEFELLEEKKIMPSAQPFDGFYMAKMIRKN